MSVLIVGVLLWSVVHLLPSLMPAQRARLLAALGENKYKGLFSLALVVALVLIVVGWRNAEVRAVYHPPLYGSPVITLLMFVSFLLFAAASAPGNIKRWLRHPMLTGMALWGATHLLANGDNRSIVLFGGLGLWAVVEIVTVSRRDGAWQKAAAVPFSKDVMTVVATAVIFAAVAYGHRWLFGVPAIPGL
ncbi:MAG: NnrU family protein [Woeseiaceae bacterium]|nr:NnrU family protein [Woeseiaceae bacterium]